MLKGFAYFLITILVFSSFTNVSLANETKTKTIPPWIKNNARLWSQGNISDKEFVSAMGFLSQKDIIHVTTNNLQNRTMTISDDLAVPLWIKNNARLWSDGSISDSNFVADTQYLINNNIISFSNLKVSKEPTISCLPDVISMDSGTTTSDDFAKVQISKPLIGGVYLQHIISDNVSHDILLQIMVAKIPFEKAKTGGDPYEVYNQIPKVNGIGSNMLISFRNWNVSSTNQIVPVAVAWSYLSSGPVSPRSFVMPLQSPSGSENTNLIISVPVESKKDFGMISLKTIRNLFRVDCNVGGTVIVTGFNGFLGSKPIILSASVGTKNTWSVAKFQPQSNNEYSQQIHKSPSNYCNSINKYGILDSCWDYLSQTCDPGKIYDFFSPCFKETSCVEYSGTHPNQTNPCLDFVSLRPTLTNDCEPWLNDYKWGDPCFDSHITFCTEHPELSGIQGTVCQDIQIPPRQFVYPPPKCFELSHFHLEESECDWARKTYCSPTGSPVFPYQCEFDQSVLGSPTNTGIRHHSAPGCTARVSMGAEGDGATYCPSGGGGGSDSSMDAHCRDYSNSTICKARGVDDLFGCTQNIFGPACFGGEPKAPRTDAYGTVHNGTSENGTSNGNFVSFDPCDIYYGAAYTECKNIEIGGSTQGLQPEPCQGEMGASLQNCLSNKFGQEPCESLQGETFSDCQNKELDDILQGVPSKYCVGLKGNANLKCHFEDLIGYEPNITRATSGPWRVSPCTGSDDPGCNPENFGDEPTVHYAPVVIPYFSEDEIKAMGEAYHAVEPVIEFTLFLAAWEECITQGECGNTHVHLPPEMEHTIKPPSWWSSGHIIPPYWMKP